MRTITFQLADADGVLHTYNTTLHPASEGQEIMWALLALASGPLAAALKGVTPLFTLVKGKRFSQLLDDPEVVGKAVDLLSTMDLDSVGVSVRRAIVESSCGALVAKILCKTLRDDKPLERQTNFDNAYAGNYQELVLAVWEVASANRFLPLPGMSPGAKSQPKSLGG